MQLSSAMVAVVEEACRHQVPHLWSFKGLDEVETCGGEERHISVCTTVPEVLIARPDHGGRLSYTVNSWGCWG